MKKYELQKRVLSDPAQRLEIWQKVMQSDDIEALKPFMTENYRIVDTATKNVFFSHNEEK